MFNVRGNNRSCNLINELSGFTIDNANKLTYDLNMVLVSGSSPIVMTLDDANIQLPFDCTIFNVGSGLTISFTGVTQYVPTNENPLLLAQFQKADIKLIDNSGTTEVIVEKYGNP